MADLNIDNPNRLLLRQLAKLPDDGIHSKEGLEFFLNLVNQSYNSFDEERRLNAHIGELSSKELERANEQLDEKNKFLDSFNHGMAHDVKNHTSNIIGLVSMLKKYVALQNPAMVNTIIEKLDLSSNQLTAIVQGFLYLSRAEANIDNHFVVINKDELINAIRSETLFLSLAKECNINYSIEVTDLFFSFHVVKIILVNLISNSIKFSKKEGPVIINAAVTNAADHVEIRVKDNGIGMDLKNPKNKIFELFNRTGNSNLIKGTGVGLFIIKKIVERQNGTIHVESTLGEGTTFKITIPLKQIT